MKRGVLWLTCLLGCAGWLGPVRATAAEAPANPYESIMERNIFGLKPPPTLEIAPTNPPPPQVKLLGVARVFGRKKALMKIAEGSRPVDMNKDPTVVLEEGQGEKGVELLEIDEANATVKVDNHGTVAVVPFDKDTKSGALLGTAASPAFMAGVPQPINPAVLPGAINMPVNALRAEYKQLSPEAQAAALEAQRERIRNLLQQRGTMPYPNAPTIPMPQ